MTARPWFRFHLATLLVLVVAAGILLGANLSPHRVPEMNGEAYGFPLPMYQNWKPEHVAGGGVRLLHDSYIKIGSVEFRYSKNGWSYSLLAINAAACLFILAVVAFCVERFMRRKAG